MSIAREASLIRVGNLAFVGEVKTIDSSLFFVDGTSLLDELVESDHGLGCHSSLSQVYAFQSELEPLLLE